MGSTAWKALGLALAALFVVIFGVALGLGGCPGTIETAVGGAVPMKCHWAFLAVAWTSPLGVIAGLLACFGRTCEGRRVACILAMAVAAVVAGLPSPLGVGICSAADMGCQLTAILVWAFAALAFVASALLALKADPAAAAKPKRSL